MRSSLVLALVVSAKLVVADSVDICEVLQHPQSFNGQMISIRARVQIDAEYFGVYAPPCLEKMTNRFWLEYGSGPKTQPTIWCCGDLTPRDPLALIQDAAFQ